MGGGAATRIPRVTASGHDSRSRNGDGGADQEIRRLVGVDQAPIAQVLLPGEERFGKSEDHRIQVPVRIGIAGTDPDDDVDIWRIYYNIGESPASTDHTFFMIVGPEFGEYNFQTKTYAIMLDFDQDGTYDKVYINDPASDDDRYGWHTWGGSAWSTSPTEDGSDNHVAEGFPRWNGDRHDIVKFAIDDNDFNSGDDNVFDYKVVTIDDDDSPFSSGETWAATNSPTEETTEKDYTGSTTIPEFSTLLMPIASVILIVGYNNRLKRKYSNQH